MSEYGNAGGARWLVPHLASRELKKESARRGVVEHEVRNAGQRHRAIS